MAEGCREYEFYSMALLKAISICSGLGVTICLGDIEKDKITIGEEVFY